MTIAFTNGCLSKLHLYSCRVSHSPSADFFIATFRRSSTKGLKKYSRGKFGRVQKTSQMKKKTSARSSFESCGLVNSFRTLWRVSLLRNSPKKKKEECGKKHPVPTFCARRKIILPPLHTRPWARDWLTGVFRRRRDAIKIPSAAYRCIIMYTASSA